MAEFDAVRFAAVLAANAQLNLGARLSAEVAGDFHQATNASLIDGCERVRIHNVELGVSRKKTAGIVPAHSQRGLCKIVCAKTEELGIACDLVRDERCARDFDHCPDEIGEFRLLFLRHFAGYATDDIELSFNSRGNPTSGIMISGRTLVPLACTSAAASKIARACISEISG